MTNEKKTDHARNLTESNANLLRELGDVLDRVAIASEEDGNEKLWLYLAELEGFTKSIDDLACEIYDDVKDREYYRDKEAIGYWVLSNTVVIEALEIDHGIEDFVTIKDSDGEISSHIIQYEGDKADEGNAYIEVAGHKLDFIDCVRV